VYKLFDRIASRVPPGSDRLIFLPWLYGERTPIEDHTVRSALVNMSLSTTREHIIRSVLEGVAMNSRWLLGAVEKFSGHRMDTIAMIGGGANSDVWCQIYADVLNRKIKQIEDPIQANLRGAVFIASVGLGHIGFDEIPDLVAARHVFEPDPKNCAIYDELFAEYVNLYQKNRKIFARLNRRR
jgi:xylulokinase